MIWKDIASAPADGSAMTLSCFDSRGGIYVTVGYYRDGRWLQLSDGKTVKPYAWGRENDDRTQ